jgi:hypothetical protein
MLHRLGTQRSGPRQSSLLQCCCEERNKVGWSALSLGEQLEQASALSAMLCARRNRSGWEVLGMFLLHTKEMAR